LQDQEIRQTTELEDLIAADEKTRRDLARRLSTSGVGG